jgi:hypothetical protein
VVQRLREGAPRGRTLPAEVRDLQAEAGQMEEGWEEGWEGWEEALVRWMREGARGGGERCLTVTT